MKRYSYILFSVMLLALGMRLSAVGADFSRYGLILERRPFASVTALDDAEEEVVTLVAPPAFVKDLRMCAITESPAGVQVGFVNIRSKPPQPYYLYIGDSEDGIELVDADYDKEGALLRKDAEQYWLYMRGDAPSGGSVPPEPSASVPPVASSIRTRTSGVSRPAAGGGNSVSYAERRRRRLEEMRKRAADARKLSEAEIEKRLQEYQMDLIRKGLTPLEFQLTEEMDRQLVEEGVLPAVVQEMAE